MTLEELGKKTKARYPEYANIDDRTLGEKVAEKYPVYKREIDEYQKPVQSQPTQNTQQAKTEPEKKQSIWSKIGNALTSSEQKFGDTLGQSVAAISGTGKTIEKANQTYMDTGNKFVQMMKNTTDPAKRANYLKLANENFANAGSTYKAVLPAIEKTNKQILGEAAGVGLDVLTAGTFSKSKMASEAGAIAKAAKSGTGLIGTGKAVVKAIGATGTGSLVKTAAKTVLPVATNTALKTGGKTLLSNTAKTIVKPTTILRGTAKGIASGATIGGAYGAVGAAQENKSVLQGAKSGATSGAVVGGALGAISTGTTNYLLSKTQKAAKTNEKINNLVGNVTQGDKKQIEKARQALQTLDVNEVKKFSDLKKVSSEKIESIARKQDEILSSFPDKIPVENLGKQIGSKEQNFVKQGISQLKKFYDETEDIEKFAKIENFEANIAKEGITAKEINDLAREYNAEIASKAFSKVTGEPLTSINKIASENVRRGLKEVSRDVLPDETSRILDKEMSNLFTLKATSEKLEDSVQKLQNKVMERGLVEKVGRSIGKVFKNIPVVGSGSRGLFTALLDSNVGNKSMNALKLEKELATSLQKINKLNRNLDKMSDGQIIRYIEQIMTDSRSMEAASFIKRQIIGKS